MNTKSSKFTALALLTGAITLASCGQSTAPKATPNANTSTKPALSMPTTDQGTGRWFIELEGEVGPGGLSAQSITAQQAQFRALAASRNIQYQEVASFDTVFNGFSVKADELTVRQLAKLPGVVNVFPVVKIDRPVTQAATSTPDMAYAGGMTGAQYLRTELGLTGKDVKVAVMDTGIDNEHPAFAGRIVNQYDFVGDAFGSENEDGSFNFTPVPDENADDCGGHGTHVAGIVGGSDPVTGFSGVAPGVKFGAYKVFGCEGSTSADIMIAAMERAARDGMQILNMSIGASFQWPDYPTAKAANNLTKRGMIVTVSAGNSGTQGQFATGAPSLGEDIIAVASIDNVNLDLSNFTLSTDGSRAPFNAVAGAEPLTVGETYEVVRTPNGTKTTANDGCSVNGASPFAPGSFTGKAVLIRRGTCSFREKVLNAQAAGAAAVLLYNNQPGFFNATVAASGANDNIEIEIPVVMVPRDFGDRMSDQLVAGQLMTIFVNPDVQTYGNPTGGTASGFSSYGASPDLNLKPDVAAPGGSIRSTYPLSVDPTGYANLSGTSMAAPHLAGIAALMLEAKPDLQAKDARALFQNTAVPTRLFLNNAVTALTDSVQKQGAGLVSASNAYASLQTGARVTPSKLALGESDAFPTRTKILVLRNNGPLKQTFTVRHLPAVALGGTIQTPALSAAAATVTVNGTATTAAAGPTITLAPFSSAELTVAVTAPTAPALGQYGGYLTMTSDTSTNLTVPYSGFIGDFQRIPVLTNARFGSYVADFPILVDPVADYEEGGYLWEEREVPTAAQQIIYTFQEVTVGEGADAQKVIDRPQLLIHFGFQARRVTYELLNGNGDTVDTLDTWNYVGRNGDESVGPGLDAYDVFTWDGKRSDGNNAANGQYRLRVRVLKALGDESNPAHYETYTSQLFTIQR